MVRNTVADNDKIDIYGHIIQNVSEYIYIEGYYLEKAKKTKRKVFHKQLNKLLYVCPGEIFCLAVPVIKGYLRCKTITCQNVSSEEQIKNFFIS